MSGEGGGKVGEKRPEEWSEGVGGEPDLVAELRMPAEGLGPQRYADELDADREEDEKGKKQFAGSALCEPAIHPEKNHAQEEEDGEAVEEENESGPGEEMGFCDADADGR